jgi:hypothetical protein
VISPLLSYLLFSTARVCLLLSRLELHTSIVGAERPRYPWCTPTSPSELSASAPNRRCTYYLIPPLRYKSSACPDPPLTDLAKSTTTTAITTLQTHFDIPISTDIMGAKDVLSRKSGVIVGDDVLAL